MTTAPFDLLRTALADRYRIERELGQGGMATVYLARDIHHDREVALKVLRPELAAMLGRERFLNEIRLTAKLEHPHILTLIDSGETQGLLWYVLPFVRGESLRQRLTRERQLDIAEALSITRQIGAALDYAHQKGIIHRDLKPENILLHEGEAMLADFGIALAVKEAGGSRLTETGLALGTPQYMSPEQATGDRMLDARSDVYSLGAMVYEMLAGEPPHSGATAQAIVARLMTERPTRLRIIRESVPEAMDSAVSQALAKVPADRFPSAGAFATALTRAPAARRPRLAVRPVVLGAIGLAVLAIVASATFGHRAARGASPTAPATRTQLTFSGRADYPVLSPDAAYVAYVERRECTSPADCTSDIVVQETSPTGSRRVVGTVRNGNVWQWSPDSRRLLVADVVGSTVLNSVVTVLGGEQKSLGAHQAIWTESADTMLSWYIGARDDRIWITTLRASDLAPIDSVAFGPTWLVNGMTVSPDGRWIAVAHIRRGGVAPMLSIADRQGVVRDSIDHADAVVGWSSGSDRIYYQVSAGNGWGEESDLFSRAVDMRTGHLSPSPVALGRFQGSRFNVAGGTLVFDESSAAEGTIWALERSGASGPFRSRQLHRWTAIGSALISRDGARAIAFTGQRTGDTTLVRLWGLPLTGEAAPTELARVNGPLFFDVSPDGRRAIVVFFRGSGQRINILDLDSGRLQPLGTPPTPAGIVGWTTGDRFVWIPAERGDLVVLDRTWAIQRRVTWPDSAGRPIRVIPSPDSAEAAILTVRPVGDSLGYALYRLGLDDGQVRPIARSVPAPGGDFVDPPPRWARDGWIHLAARDPGRGGRLLRVRVSDGQVIDEGLPPVKGQVLEGFTISDDGRRAIEWVANWSRDIVLIRNFDPDGDR